VNRDICDMILSPHKQSVNMDGNSSGVLKSSVEAGEARETLSFPVKSNASIY